MKFNFKMLALLMSVTVSPLMAGTKQGSDSGGGGGAYKMAPGKYLTPPEAGILISDKKTAGKRYDKYYNIKRETIAEVEELIGKINKTISGSRLSSGEVLGFRDTFILQNVDEAQYKKIKAEYKIVFQKYGYKLDDEKFVLPAYSVSDSSLMSDAVLGKTYIFPDFDLLTFKQQAKILIHEYNMRKFSHNSRKERLKNALAVDVVINDIANDKDVLKIDFTNAYRNFYKAGLLDDSAAATSILGRMLDEMKKPLKLSDIILNEDDAIYREYSIDHIRPALDPRLIQSLQDDLKLKENYAQLLEGPSITLYKHHNVNQTLANETNEGCDKIEENTPYEFIMSKTSENRIIIYKCAGGNAGKVAYDHKYIGLFGSLEFFNN